jgi:hypothetical protein
MVSGIAVILAVNGSVVAETVHIFTKIEVVITRIDALITGSDTSCSNIDTFAYSSAMFLAVRGSFVAEMENFLFHHLGGLDNYRTRKYTIIEFELTK